MARYTYPIPLDGRKYPAVLARRCKGLVLNNRSDVPVAVDDDNGHTFICPAGQRQAFNSDSLVVPRYYSSVGGGSGNATAEFHSGQVDTSGNPPTTQPPGTVTVGNDLTDPQARAFLAALQGLLPQSLTTLTYPGGWSEQTLTLLNAVTTFSIAVQPPSYSAAQTARHFDGTLWVWYEVGGTRIYVEDLSYWTFTRANTRPSPRATWLHYNDYVPAGGKIGIGYDGEASILLRA